LSSGLTTPARRLAARRVHFLTLSLKWSHSLRQSLTMNLRLPYLPAHEHSALPDGTNCIIFVSLSRFCTNRIMPWLHCLQSIMIIPPFYTLPESPVKKYQ
jgi:hypothetical protein